MAGPAAYLKPKIPRSSPSLPACHRAHSREGPVLAILPHARRKGDCPWVRVVLLLPSVPLRSMACRSCRDEERLSPGQCGGPPASLSNKELEEICV